MVTPNLPTGPGSIGINDGEINGGAGATGGTGATDGSTGTPGTSP